MVRYCLFLVAISGLALVVHASLPGDPFQVMNNVMRRMRAELERTAFHERARQVDRFKQHVGHIVQVHLVIRRGGSPPPAVKAQLQALMQGSMTQMQNHMIALVNSVRIHLGSKKEHLLVKKVRQHCNRHIALRRQRIMRRLKEKPKKRFVAASGRWTETEARKACHRLGGHLAVINDNEEHREALKEILAKKSGQFFINVVRPHNRHVFVASFRAISRSFFHPPPFGCAVFDRNKKGPEFVACNRKAGALCEFLTFNPFLHHVGRKGYFTTSKKLSFDGGKRLCEKLGGRIAAIFNTQDQEWAKGNNTNGPAFIDLRRRRLSNESVWQMASRPLQWSHFREHGDGRERFDCFAMARDGLWDPVPCSRPLSALCEATVVADTEVRAENPLNDGKYFVAVNGAKDEKISREAAKRRCARMNGGLARIRSNSQQVAAVAALKHGLPVLVDALSKDTHGWYRWSDGTRLARTQEWRLGGRNATAALTLDKFGVWGRSDAKMGYLCEIPYRRSGMANDRYYIFSTDIRMDIDFDLVTALPGAEAQFTRNLEAAVKEFSAVKGIKIYGAVVVKLRPGSTVATVRLFSDGTGRAEAAALQRAIDSHHFVVMFKGRKIRPTPHQRLNIHFSMFICYGPIAINRRILYTVIPSAVGVFGLLVIIALVLLMKKRKRRRRQIDSIFTVNHEKELYTAEEKKKLEAISSLVEPPPPYPVSVDAPPDYNTVLANEPKI